jgi:RimJ/RimL family protein N-acetyltransferase
MIILETDRLLFRDHELADMEAFCAMEADPEVRKYVGGRPRSRPEAEARFRSIYLPPVRDRMALWATVLKLTGNYIGYCGIYPNFGPSGPIPHEGTLAFYLARACWGQGLASEAGLAFVRFAFTELALDRIVATVQVGNDASVSILKKLGFSWQRLARGERCSYNYFQLLNPSPAKREKVDPNSDST